MNTLATDTLTHGSMRYRKNQKRTLQKKIWGALLFLILIYFTAISCKASLRVLFEGMQNGITFLGYMFPPDLSVIQEMLKPALDTVIFAFLATLFGSFLSLVMGLSAASNIAPKSLRNLSRFLLAFERALPEIIVILLLIAALGLGPFAGVVALSIGCIGMLGKLFADAIEEVNPKVLESIRSVGANPLQVIVFGVLPEVLPSLITHTIFRFEVNIRLSVLMGAVGAGGIGYELYHSFNILQYERATTAILITLMLVFFSEKTSSFLRKKLIPTGGLK